MLTSDNIIGFVFFDPNLLATGIHNSCFQGWVPIFDSLQGLRGDLYIFVKVVDKSRENIHISSSMSMNE